MEPAVTLPPCGIWKSLIWWRTTVIANISDILTRLRVVSWIRRTYSPPRINIRRPIRAKHAAGCISSSFIKTLLSGNSTINHENYTSGGTIFWSPNFSSIPRHLKLSAYIPVNPLCTRDLLIQYILSCFGWIKQQAKRLWKTISRVFTTLLSRNILNPLPFIWLRDKYSYRPH